MIASYNRSKIIRGVLCMLGSVVCFVLAWLFFRYSIGWLLRNFSQDAGWAPWIAALVLVVICISGYATWKRGQGFQGYVESALYHDFSRGTDNAGADLVGLHVHRVTGPAYVLGQVFLGGPLLLLRGVTHFRQVLPHEAGLEARLHHTLGILRAACKWQSLTDYPDLRREILLLAQMKQIDFSAHKGTPRIKASPPDGI